MAARTKAALFALLAGAWTTPARAQEADAHALAVQLFEEAGRAQDKGAYEEACPKFARVVAIEPGKVGAKIALADCYDAAGKLASAVAAYRAAGVHATQVGDPRGKWAEERAAALDVRVPRVTVRVPETLASLPGLGILEDGAPLLPAQWNLAIPTDPGEHAIHVTATGKKPWSGKVTVAAFAHAEVVLGGLEDLPPAPAPVPALPPAPPPAAPAAPREVPAWAWATGGAGVASVAVAIAFGVDQAATQRDFDAQCKNPPRNAAACDARSNRLYRDFGLWLGLGAAGVAALAAATIGTLASPRHRPPVVASPWIGPRGAGVVLGGRF